MADKKQPSDKSRAAADKLVLAIANHFGDVAKFYVPSIVAKVSVALDESAFAARAKIVAEIRLALGLDDSKHARHNLNGALSNINHSGIVDNICTETIMLVMGQLAHVERIIKYEEK